MFWYIFSSIAAAMLRYAETIEFPDFNTSGPADNDISKCILDKENLLVLNHISISLVQVMAWRLTDDELFQLFPTPMVTKIRDNICRPQGHDELNHVRQNAVCIYMLWLKPIRLVYENVIKIESFCLINLSLEQSSTTPPTSAIGRWQHYLHCQRTEDTTVLY